MPCARKILTTLARKAYRRPVTDAETERLLTYFQRGRNNDGTFDSGIENALAFLLVNPQFLFRSETDPRERGYPARLIASAIMSWHRAFRFSCGAAFPTNNC